MGLLFEETLIRMIVITEAFIIRSKLDLNIFIPFNFDC